jgi:hypothetical protein
MNEEHEVDESPKRGSINRGPMRVADTTMDLGRHQHVPARRLRGDGADPARRRGDVPGEALRGNRYSVLATRSEAKA